jgi:hypothetical protein
MSEVFHDLLIGGVFESTLVAGSTDTMEEI